MEILRLKAAYIIQLQTQHYFTIAFSGAFLAFFSAISDSMPSLANSTKLFFVTMLSANSSLQALVC